MPKEMKRERAFLESTLNELIKLYPTSSILKMFENTLDHYSIKNQKFVSHMIISSSQEKFIENVNKIGGILLFIITLERLIKGALKEKKKAKIHELLEIMEKNHRLDEDILFSLEIASLLYELMLTYDIIAYSVPLEKVYTSPI